MRKLDRFFFICGLLMLASELWKQYTITFSIGHGQYNWWYFPFQLCSLAMYLCLALPFCPSARLRLAIHTFLMTFSLMGGVFVFFDTRGMHYLLTVLTVHSYLWHFTLIGIGIVSGICCLEKLTWRSMADSTCIFGIACVIATILNTTLVHLGNINMFYISPYYKMAQIVFRDIAQITGNGLGILFYVIMVVLGAWLFFWVWIIIGKLTLLLHRRFQL